MTTYGPTIAPPRHHHWTTPRRLWAAAAVLVLAGIATLVVLLTSSGSDEAHPAVPSRVGTVQDHGHGPAFDCRPTNVPQPC